MGISFPNESAEYRAARNRLLEKETELRRALEAVAQARRALPKGGVIPEDYVFDGVGAKVKFSELFAAGKDTLIVYDMMFPRHPADDRPAPTSGTTAKLALYDGPCPSCTSLLDELDGAVPHLEGAGVNFAVTAKTSIDRLATFGKERGWRHLRLLSAAGTRYKRDYHSETQDGSSLPLLSVFQREGHEIRHFWSSELLFAPPDPGQDPRHVGTVEALWNLLDLTPAGRPSNWNEQLTYSRAP